MKGAKFWAIFMAALLTFSTLANDYMVANAEEIEVTESTETTTEAVEETNQDYSLDMVSEASNTEEEVEAVETVAEETEAAETTEETAEETGEEITDPEEAVTEETDVVEDEATEPTEEETTKLPETDAVEYPAKDFGEFSAAGMTVAISAPEGAFPEGTTVKVTEVSNYQAMEYAESALANDGTEVVDAKAVDITFYNNEGTEIQPECAINVEFSGAGLEEADDYALIHVDDNGNAEVVGSADVSENGAEAELSTFSIYVMAATINIQVKVDGEILTATTYVKVNSEVELHGSGSCNKTKGRSHDGAYTHKWTVSKASGYTIESGNGTADLKIKFTEPGEYIIWHKYCNKPNGNHDANYVTESITITVAKTNTITYTASNGGKVRLTTKNDSVKSVNEEAGLPNTNIAGAVAIPDQGYHFVNWTDASSKVAGTGVQYKPSSVTTDSTYTANFAKDAVITYEATEGGSVSSSSATLNYSSEEVTVTGSTASANEGYVFDGWYKNDELVSEELVFAPSVDANTEDTTYTAKFISQSTDILTQFTVVSDKNTINVGGTATISTIILPEEYSSKAVKYSSSDDSVVSIDAAGKVHGLSVGTAIITATLKENSEYSDSVAITVEPVYVSSVVISGYTELNNDGTYNFKKPDDKIDLKASVEPGNAEDKSIVWSSLDTNVATVDQNGRVSIKNGLTGIKTVEIRAENVESGKYDTVTIHVCSKSTRNVTVKLWQTNKTIGNIQLSIPSDEIVDIADILPATKTVEEKKYLFNGLINNGSNSTNWDTMKAWPKVAQVKYNGNTLYYRENTSGTWNKVSTINAYYDQIANESDVYTTIRDWAESKASENNNLSIRIITQKEDGTEVYNSGELYYHNGHLNKTYLGDIHFTSTDAGFYVSKVEIQSKKDYTANDSTYETISTKTGNPVGDYFTVQFKEGSKSYRIIATLSPIQYTVSYDVNGGTGEAPATVTGKVKGDTITVAGTPVPSKDGYMFAGWEYAGTTYQGGDTFTMPAENVVLNARWIASQSVVQYMSEDTDMGTVSRNGEIVKAERNLLGSTATPNEGYTFKGWYDGENCVSSLATFVPSVKDAKTYVAKFENASVNYTVNYYLNSVGAENRYRDVVNKTGIIGQPVNEVAIDIPGYSTNPTSQQLVLVSDAASNVINFVYSPNEYGYTVKYLLQEIDGSYKETTSYEESGKAYFGTSIIVNKKEIPNYTYSSDDSAGKTITTNPDENVVCVKYDLNEYTLSFDLDGGTYNDATSVAPVTMKVGAEEAIATPVKTGYKFTGWTLDDGNKGGVLDASAKKFTMGNGDAKLTATWVQYTYTVKVYYQNAAGFMGDTTDNGYTLSLEQSGLTVTGDKVNVAALKTQYAPETANAYQAARVVPSGDEFTLNEDSSKNLIKLYYDLKVYKVELNYNPCDGLSERDITASYDYTNKNVKYDEQKHEIQYACISSDFELPALTTTKGYEFLGWKDTENFDGIFSRTDKTVTVTASTLKDYSYKAKWTEGNVSTTMYVLYPENSRPTEVTSTTVLSSKATGLFTSSIGTATIDSYITGQYVTYAENNNADYISNIQTKSGYVDSRSKIETVNGEKYLVINYDGYKNSTRISDIDWYVIKHEEKGWHIDGESTKWTKIPYVYYQVEGITPEQAKLSKTQELLAEGASLSQLVAPTFTTPEGYYFVGWDYEGGAVQDTFANATNGKSMPGHSVTLTAHFAQKAALTLTVNKYSEYYNGTEQSIGNDYFTSSVSGLTFENVQIVKKDTTEAVKSTNVINVDTTITNRNNIVVKDADGKDVTKQYAISYEDNTFEIKKVELTVTTPSDSKVYDGTPLTKAGSITGFVAVDDNKDVYTFETTGSQTEVGSSQNTYSLDWKDSTKAGNYTVKENLGTLTVNEYAGKIIVTTTGGTFTYDGTEHGATVEVTGLPKTGYTVITATSNAKATHVAEGEKVAKCDTLVIKNAAGENVTNKLNIEYKNDKLKITPATLTVTTPTDSKVYDGTALTKAGTISGFVKVGEAAETATFATTGSQTEVGNSVNTYSLVFDGTAKESDYTVSETKGTLTVTEYAGEIKVTTTGGTFTYDGEAHGATVKVEVEGFVANTLPAGYTLVTATSSATATHVAEGTVKATCDNLVIKNEAGVDVTNKLHITKVDGSITINPATLTVTTPTDSKVYDGTALTKAGTISGFATVEGVAETATFTTTGTQTEVGSSENTYSLVFDGTAVKTDYTVSESIGTLTVTESTDEIVVTTTGGEFTYDGEAHGATVQVSALPTGYTLVTATASATATHVSEGTVKATCDTLVIKNASGTDVTSKLNITKVDGSIKIKPATLSVVTPDANKTYDGTALTAEGTISGFVKNETATFTTTGSQTAVGNSKNTYSLVFDGTAAESDYTVSEKVGKLVVSEYTGEIVVKTTGGEFVYDGEAHGATVQVSTLPAGYTLEAATSDDTATHVADGKVTANCDTLVIKNAADEDVTDKLNIKYENGTISITPATLTVTTPSDSKVYDGTALTAEGTISGFVKDETATFTTTGSQTAVGNSKNTYSLVFDGTAADSDYTVSETKGTLTVTEYAGEIKVTTTGGTFTYNGEAHGATVKVEVEGFDANTLPVGYTLETATSDDTATHVAEGTVTANCDTLVIKNAAGEDVTDKLSIKYVDGTINITPKKVTITTESDEKVYDGEALTAPGNIEGIVEGETYAFKVTGSQKRVGNSANTYDLKWDGTAVATDYEITESIGTLVVKQSDAEIVVTTTGGTFTYDGEAHGAIVTVGKMPKGYSVKTAESSATATDVTTSSSFIGQLIANVVGDKGVEATADKLVILNEDGDDVTSEMKITYINGIIVVKPATVTVSTPSASKVYDGEALKSAGIISGIVDGETVSFETTGSQTEVGSSTNTYALNWNGTAKKDNYKVVEKLGQLEVTEYAGEFLVEIIGGKYVYDGSTRGATVNVSAIAPSVAGSEEIEMLGASATNIPTGYTVQTATSDAKATHVGKVVADQKTVNLVILNKNNKDVTSKLNIKYVPGEIEITPATLTVITPSARKQFDGTPLKKAGSYSGLMGTDTITFKTTGSRVVVGSSKNSYKIDWSGASENDYEVAEQIGTLTVTEAPAGDVPGDEPTNTPDEVTPAGTTPVPTPVAPVADVLGANRGIEADAGSVLGARRIPGEAAVLGARRDAATSDANQLALYLVLMGIATGVGSAYTLGRRKKRQ